MQCDYCRRNFKNQKCINLRKEKFKHDNNRQLRETDLANKLFQNVDNFHIITHKKLDADALFSNPPPSSPHPAENRFNPFSCGLQNPIQRKQEESLRGNL